MSSSRSGVTLHSPSRQRTRVPSASRAPARPSGGLPYSVASSGRSDSGTWERALDQLAQGYGRALTDGDAAWALAA